MIKSYQGYLILFLTIASIFAILTGISTIISKNPVFSILFLIGLFLVIAVYLVLIGLNFMGLGYLIIYVGAIAILFLFIIMLINIRISELVSEGKNSIPLAILTVLSFNFSVNETLPYNSNISELINVDKFFAFNINSTIGLDFFVSLLKSSVSTMGSVTNLLWETILVGTNHASAIGNIFYSALYIYLIIISLILLLAMVGSIMIMVNKTKNSILSYVNDLTIKLKPSDLAILARSSNEKKASYNVIRSYSFVKTQKLSGIDFFTVILGGVEYIIPKSGIDTISNNCYEICIDTCSSFLNYCFTGTKNNLPEIVAGAGLLFYEIFGNFTFEADVTVFANTGNDTSSPFENDVVREIERTLGQIENNITTFNRLVEENDVIVEVSKTQLLSILSGDNLTGGEANLLARRLDITREVIHGLAHRVEELLDQIIGHTSYYNLLERFNNYKPQFDLWK